MDAMVRSESPVDYDAIDEVIESAFNQKNEAKLVRSLRTTEKYDSRLSIVALKDESLIGHMLLYPVKVGNFETLILAPMSVKPSYQKKGIGEQLIWQGFKKAVELGYDSVIVVGYPKYYPKFGFEKASKWNIKLPFDVPDEAFMAIELKDGSLNEKEGLVELPAPYLEC